MSRNALPAVPALPAVARLLLAGLSASLVGIGLARFAYTPLIPALIQAHWFTASDAVRLGAANLAGYLAGAIVGRPLGARLGNATMLRAAMGAVAAAFLACAFPLSVAWFFAWRFLSGAAGGVVMVLVAATLLPHVPAARRGLAGGAIFLGLGLGIAGSGTVVPLLLAHGLRAAWIGLAVLSAAFTSANWLAWPGPASGATAAGDAAAPPSPPTAPAAASPSAPGMALLQAQYALMAVGLVPAMVFLVDFVARGLAAGARQGALAWVLYGAGAIVGPPLYGWLGDRLGTRAALRLVIAVQAVALLALVALASLRSPLALAPVVVVVGSFPPGIVPLVLARVHELEPHGAARQDAAWSRATVVFATAQAVSGYAYAALFDASHGAHRVLFLVAAAALAAGLALDFLRVAGRPAARGASQAAA